MSDNPLPDGDPAARRRETPILDGVLRDKLHRLVGADPHLLTKCILTSEKGNTSQWRVVARDGVIVVEVLSSIDGMGSACWSSVNIETMPGIFLAQLMAALFLEDPS